MKIFDVINTYIYKYIHIVVIYKQKARKLFEWNAKKICNICKAVLILQIYLNYIRVIYI